MPVALGTVWTAGAKIRYISEAVGKWVTVATCIDTPNEILKALNEAKKVWFDKTLWVKSDVYGNYIPNPLTGLP